MYKKGKAIFLDLLFIVVGSAIYAVSVNAFTAPNQIAPGGMTGVATMLFYLIQMPIGLGIAILNIPIIIWGIIEIGYKMVAKSILAIAAMSFLVDLFAGMVPAYQGDLVLTSIFAGVLEGIGLSLVFLRGATTGGSDMIARLLTKRLRHISMGKLMLFVDAIIVVASAFVFKSIESGMYACIVIFVSTSLIDAILYGADAGTGKMFFIFSSKNQEIGNRILKEMDRGVTYFRARGGYSLDEGEMLFCAVRRFEVFKINEIIRTIDKNAFVIVGDAGEISGEGFRATSSDDKSLRDLFKKAERAQKLENNSPNGSQE